MVLLDHVWDDVMGGAQPERGLGRLRKDLSGKPLNIKGAGGGDSSTSSKYQRSMTMPSSPGSPSSPVTPTTPSPTAARRDNVWRSVFHPGSNLATRDIGAEKFDNTHANAPTVYDWLYNDETRSKHM